MPVVPVLYKEDVQQIRGAWTTELLQILHQVFQNRNSTRYVRFRVLMVAGMKLTALLDIAPF